MLTMITITRIVILIFALFVIVGPFFVVREYSVISNLISELGSQNHPTSNIMAPCFLILGIGIAVDGLRKRSFSVAPFMLFGLFIAIAGLCPQKPMNLRLPFNSSSYNLHSLFASLAVISITIGLIWQWVLSKDKQSKNACFHLALVCFASPILMLALNDYKGIIQRLMYLQILSWMWVMFPDRIIANNVVLVNRITRIAILAFTLFIVAGSLSPVQRYSVVSNLVHELGSQSPPNSYMIMLGFLILGVGVLIDGLRKRSFSMTPFMLFGLFIAIAGLCPRRSMNLRLPFNSTLHNLHSLFASLAGISITVGLLWQGIISKVKRSKMICFCLAIVCFAFPILMLALDDYHGIIQRLMYLQVLVWMWFMFPDKIIMSKWNKKYLGASIPILVILFLVNSFTYEDVDDYLHSQKRWIKKTKADLLKMHKQGITEFYPGWADDDYYYFGLTEGAIRIGDDGWVYIITHSVHDDEKRERKGKVHVGDVSLAIDHLGNFYVNYDHVCGALHLRSELPDRFRDIETFIETSSQGCEWELLE